MENENGSKEMLELVERYSVINVPTPDFFAAPISISESGVQGEVVVSHSYPHFSASTEEC